MWTSDSGLELTFGSGATLVPAPSSRRLLLGCDPLSTLQLLPLGVLSALLSCVPVAAPLAPVLPAPVVAAPQVVGVCDLLSLDAGQSTGSGGRAMTFTWSILGAVATASNAAVAPGLALPSSALTGVQAALALATTSSQSAVAIPPSALPADAVLEVACVAAAAARANKRSPPLTCAKRTCGFPLPAPVAQRVGDQLPGTVEPGGSHSEHHTSCRGASTPSVGRPKLPRCMLGERHCLARVRGAGLVCAPAWQDQVHVGGAW